MESQINVVEKAVSEALQQIEQNAPEEYKKLNADPDEKEKIVQAATDAATEELELADKFRGIPTKDIAKNLSKHLSEDRINLIKSGLKIPTFRLTITKQDNGQHLVEFAREGKMFQPSRAVASVDDVDWANLLQFASIVVESVLLAVSVVGLTISPGEKIIREVIDETVKEIKVSFNLSNAMANFVKAWRAAEGNVFQEAAAIFTLMGDIFLPGILWSLIKSLCSNMGWFDWIFTVVKVIAMLVAALATDRVVLVAKIALAVKDLADIVIKVNNVNQLFEIKKTL